jgi:para-nitrobenzyl esterase
MTRALALVLLLLSGCASTRTVLVQTSDGPIVGRAGAGAREFRGLPYAAPPVGELRWRPPVPPAKWSQPRSAQASGRACPQPTVGRFVRRTAEDCLTLDVTTPAGPGEKLPVLVWIHGGAFYLGSGSDPLYDGPRLAARTHAVVVTLNYRLGPLGFMSHPEIARELGRAASPSFGILDQRAALEWVQRNIGAFGGDPANVTLFGESAGAWSVCAHLASPGSKGLFARAIIQSGACADALYFAAREAEAQGHALAAALGCTGEAELACLRKKTADEIANALPFRRGLLLLPGVWWGPVVDGVELPRLPLDVLRAGEGARVPVMIGAARDEGILHTAGFDHVEASEVAWFARGVFGERSEAAVTAHYARTNPKDALTDIVSNGIFSCHARRVARVLSAQGVPVYLYEWAHALDDEKAHALGATHSVDLFFVWGSAEGIRLTEREERLSRIVTDAWSRFARAGNPADASLSWPRYTIERDEHLTLDLVPSVGSRLKQAECDFWDQLPTNTEATTANPRSP